MIISFGSLNADMIYRVQAAPEDGQTISADSFSLEAGGKGANQALASARDGADVLMAGAVGNDPLSRTALENLDACGVCTDNVIRTDTLTGNAAVFVDSNGRNRIVISGGANMLVRQDQLTDKQLQEASYVLLQLETSVGEVEKLIFRCQKLGVKTILNLAPAKAVDINALKAVSLLIVNEDEAESLAGELKCAVDASALSAALGVGVIRTLGSRGSEACIKGAEFIVAAYPVTTVDTTAAGDCFIGVLTAGLDRGMDVADAMQRASVAAAICCSRSGSQSSIPIAQETDHLFKTSFHPKQSRAIS
ncbi:ribokinase [Brucella gallinifaecis]|uniref:Ribokinase n=1 Tax=Brucella gallinifaecis TaxID=215590 RepID=A0A502BSB9_9HYPH|nr:ribokinase [Brucella gallinifaecis]TPF77114.1 ribokinase [Brucella gallinifaecis]